MKSKATGCGSISTVFSSIVLLCVRSIIIRKIVILIVINSYTIIKDNDNESDDEINDLNKDKEYLKNRVYVNDNS